ncbi:hypothetical protein C8N40_11281 [Pontibacter mucosus]|uniref:Uncharacterized protein n=1 Tax=Pontibacter mucosus TaxID=1649266 RepID=A0A2T5YCM3_9BACT|nr:hypothetical protein C8N40_11281 [Pontibacter mucosus]
MFLKPRLLLLNHRIVQASCCFCAYTYSITSKKHSGKK